MTPISRAPLVAIDWGTTAVRAARLGPGGEVVDERAFPRGILSIAPTPFPVVFDELFGDWMRPPGTLCLISGMAGSQHGWLQAPYCPCPAGFAQLAQHLTWITPGPQNPQSQRIALVPGLSCLNNGTPDVMRGEEVQIFGAMRLAPARAGCFVLPGTHSKWATVAQGRVTGFRTYMTGEFYALLSQHSILAKTLQADAPWDEAAFRTGVRRAQDQPSLLHSVFAARSLALFEHMAAPALASYLSGLLIGEELRAQALPAPAAQAVTLIGSALLTARYASALSVLGVPSVCFGAEATWAGLHAISLSIDP